VSKVHPNPYWDCWIVRPTLDPGINSQVDVLITLLYRAEGMAVGCGDQAMAKQFRAGRFVLRHMIEEVAGKDFDGVSRAEGLDNRDGTA
jgi:hypothetical protein